MLRRREGTTFHRRNEARAEVERLGIEPRLLLRPIEGSRREVSLEIPDLSHLLLTAGRDPVAKQLVTDIAPLRRHRCCWR